MMMMVAVAMAMAAMGTLLEFDIVLHAFFSLARMNCVHQNRIEREAKDQHTETRTNSNKFGQNYELWLKKLSTQKHYCKS